MASLGLTYFTFRAKQCTRWYGLEGIEPLHHQRHFIHQLFYLTWINYTVGKFSAAAAEIHWENRLKFESDIKGWAFGKCLSYYSIYTIMVYSSLVSNINQLSHFCCIYMCITVSKHEHIALVIKTEWKKY